MLTVQVLTHGRSWYYTSSKSDEYYLSDLRIKGEFIGSGLQSFGITDAVITKDDTRLKHLLNGYSQDGETLLRKGANSVRTYHWFEDKNGNELTVKDKLWVSEKDVQRIKQGDFENCCKEVRTLAKNHTLDASWIATKPGKKQDYKYLVDPSTNQPVLKEKRYALDKYDVANLKDKNFTLENIDRLSRKTQALLKQHGITDPQKALRSKKVEGTPGYDLTFSAPKAVSVLWALETNKTQKDAVFQAHYQAMKDAAGFIEQYFVGRSGAGGVKSEEVKTIMALIPHFTSREGDPQLHGHLVAPNLGVKEDGKFGALDPRLVMRMQFAAGSYYRSVLAHNLQSLGYELEFRPFEDVAKNIKVPLSVRVQGFQAANEYISKKVDARERTLKNYGSTFGIKGISQELEQAFSKRTAQIKAKGVQRTDSYEKKRAAKFGTRKKKDVTETMAALEKRWLEEVRAITKKRDNAPKPNNTVERIASSPRTEAEMSIIYRDTLKRIAYNQQRGGASQAQLYTALEYASRGMLSGKNFEKEAHYIEQTFLQAHSFEQQKRFTLNSRGKVAVNYRTRVEKMQDFSRKGKQALQFLRSTSYKNGLLAHLLLGNISIWQYEKLIKGRSNTPKSVLQAKLLYASYKLSKKELRYHVTRLEKSRANTSLRFERFKRATSHSTTLVLLFDKLRNEEKTQTLTKDRDGSILLRRTL